MTKLVTTESQFPTQKQAIEALIDAGFRPYTDSVWKNKRGHTAYLASFADKIDSFTSANVGGKKRVRSIIKTEVGWWITWPVEPKDSAHQALREALGGKAYQ